MNSYQTFSFFLISLLLPEEMLTESCCSMSCLCMNSKFPREFDFLDWNKEMLRCWLWRRDYYATHHISGRRTEWILAVRYPNPLVAFVYRPKASKSSWMCGRVVVWAVIAIERLSLLKLSKAQIVLQRFFRNHHVLLLHVVLELLVKTVQSVNELVFARVHLPTLWT